MKFKEELPVVGFFYGVSALFWIAMGIMAGYWTLYFNDINISLTYIGLIFAANSIGMFLFEIPTGAIADVFGRKISVGLGYTILGVAYLGMFLAGTNITLLLILNFITGIAWTMESGAFEAWFIDTVKHKKKEKHLHKLLGRWGSTSNIGFVIGPLIGGILVKYGYEKALLTTAASMFLLGLYILTFGKEHYFKRKKLHIKKDFKKTINNAKLAIKHTKNNSTLFLVTIAAFFFTFGESINFGIYQPHIINLGFNPSFIGYGLAIAGILMVIQLNFSDKIKKFLGGNKKLLITFGTLFGLGMITIALNKNITILFLILILYSSFYDLASRNSPAYKEITNKVIPSKIRASVLSTIGLVCSVGMILGNSTFGILSDTFGTKIVLIGAGSIVIFSAMLYLKLK